VELWVGCVAGALEQSEYIEKLVKAGFAAVGIEPTRIYNIEDARAFLTDQGVDVDAIAPMVADKFMGAFVRATKPAGCCGPGCCS
jgi:arsenite methyltransferase